MVKIPLFSQKIVEKICVYQKMFVPLHRQTKTNNNSKTITIMKPTTILTNVLNQINEQIYNEEIYVQVYGKKMEALFCDGYFYICIDQSIPYSKYIKLIEVNSLLKNYVF